MCTRAFLAYLGLYSRHWGRAMVHRAVISAFVLLTPIFLQAQSATVPATIKVKVKAALYDRDLNLKPVPHLALSLHNLDQEKAEPVTLQTSFDGLAEADLPSGRYALSTSVPIEFQGRSYTWDIQLTLTKAETTVELSNDNAKATDLSGGRGAKVDELSEYFKRLKPSIVTVWTQEGHGTGFLVDPGGLILTNQHVISGFTYLAVQFDSRRKLEAVVLAEDKQQDVAVLRVNMSGLTDVAIAPIAEGTGFLLEGERVFTIGNPLDQEKVLTTGIVSKVDKNSIISDVNINPGNSGGPLFNSSGMVVGITTYGKGGSRGPGLSGIVPIADANEAMKEARQKMATTPPPSARWLPVAPAMKYPIDGLRALGSKPWDKDTYFFKLGDFNVEIITPVTAFQVSQERASRAEKEREKRAKKSGAPAAEEEHQTAEYENQYDPVIYFSVSPRLREAFWKSFGESMATPGGAPITMRFKTDFLKMRLLCGEKEVEPIRPVRYPVSIQGQSAAVRVNDATYAGSYSYTPDAISPECKTVNVEVFSAKEPDTPLVKTLDAKSVQKIWDDFEPFRKAQSAANAAAAK